MRVNNGYSHANEVRRTFLSHIKKDVAEAQAYDFCDKEENVDGVFIPQERERKKDQTMVILLNDYIRLNSKYSGKEKGGVCSLKQVDTVNQTLTTKEHKIKDIERAINLKRVDAEHQTLTAKEFPKTKEIERAITQLENSNIFKTRQDNNKQACCEKILDHKKVEVTDNVKIVGEGTCIEERCAEIQTSQIKSMPSGSISIVCQTSRVAVLVLWSVKFPSNDQAGFNIQVAPIINFLHDSEMIIGTAKYIGTALMEKFTCHHGDFNTCKTQTEALQLYGELSQFILSIKTDIATMLSEKMATLTASNNGIRYTRTIHRALQLSNTTPSISLDHLDIYKKIEIVEIEVIHRAETDSDCSLNGEDDVSCCPICFDIFNGDQMSLEACNHQVCASCWRGLLRSAASSGEPIIKCPYFRCSNILGIREIAHIMFDELYATSNTADILSSAQVLMKLVRFQIEQYLSTGTTNTDEVTNFRCCPTPSCERAFSFTKKAKKDRQSLLWSGSDIAICTCGASMCADCENKGSSHLGLTCDEYKKVRKEIDSGRMDDEFKSLQWMNKNTEPCPKCDYPISKNGGCNHMWCTKCTHYFCWLCKRPGNLCRAYSCLASRYRLDESSIRGDTIGGETYKLAYQIQQFRALTIAEEKYHAILKRGALLRNKDIELEVQLRHITVWLQTYLAIHSGNSKWSCIKLKNAVKSLEQILNIISMKNDEYQEMVPSLFDKGNINTMYAEDSLKQGSSNKELTKRKIQALNQIRKRRSDNNVFSAQLQSPKLLLSDFINMSKLSSMNVRRFKANAVSEMCGAIKQLNQKHTRRARIVSEKYPNVLIKSGPVINICPLNKRANPMTPSWKNRLLPTTSDKDRIKRPTIMRRNKTESAGKERGLRWKGKHRVKVRRWIALAQDI
mmetsp:Transcript_19277/g.22955  ORF Transcript_19277/g.22955 Transcript_19277/m.22955 type:complete len:903 (-) Transcript_19277:353-3061(-)